jgi:hypothetical protein
VSDDTSTIDNYQFLAEIFRDHDPEKETPVVCAFPEAPEEREQSGKGWPAYRPRDSAIARRIGRQAHQNNTYFCISATKEPEGEERLNRQHGSLTGTFTFPLDDIGDGDGAKYTPQSVPLLPSAIVETSDNNYQYHYFPTEPERDTARAQAILKAITKDHADSGGSIAAKYVRLPVGHNNKSSRCTRDGQPFQVRLVEWNPERRYTTDELMEAFHVEPESIDQEVRRLDRTRLRREGMVYDKDEIYDWLEKIGAIQVPPAANGFAQIVCPWADQHTTGTDTAGYSPRGLGGDFAGLRQFKCLHGHCADKTVKDFLEWVKDQRGPDLTEVSLRSYLERYVYVKTGPFVCDTHRPLQRLTLHEFHQAHMNRSYMHTTTTGKELKVYYSKEWQASEHRRTADGIGFRPVNESIYTDPVTNARLFNTFQPIPHGVQTNEIDEIMQVFAHLKYLFGDSYEDALDFIAMTIHRPAERIPYALLHVSKETGTGRGWLKQMFDKLFGFAHYHRTTNIKSIAGGDSFNEWLFESLLVSVDEVYEQGKKRYQLGDSMREIVTEPRMMINVKNGLKGDREIYANMMLLSNHINALDIPDEDRRLWVVYLEDPHKDADYYTRLYALLHSPKAMNQLWWFLHRHAKTVKVHHRAPDTIARAQLISTNKDEFAQIVDSVLDFLRDKGVECIWSPHLEMLIKQEGLTLPLDRNDSMFKRLHAHMRDKNVFSSGGRHRIPEDLRKVFGGGERQTVYVLEKYTKWKKAETSDVRREANRTGNRDELRARHGLKLV